MSKVYLATDHAGFERKEEIKKILEERKGEFDIEIEEALQMVSLYPAKVLGLDDTFGKIEKGYKANFTALDNHLNVISVL